MTSPSRSAQPPVVTDFDVQDVTARIEQRLASGAWDEDRLLARLRASAAEHTTPAPDTEAAAEVATFALGLSGRRRSARRGGRFSRLMVHFALAAMLALTSLTVACDAPDGESDTATIQVDQLPLSPATSAVLTAGVAAGPQRYQDLVLLDPNAGTRWALLAPLDQLRNGASDITPVLVDRTEADLSTPGATYVLPAEGIPVGTRDGQAQFLDGLAPAEQTGTYDGDVAAARSRVTQQWQPTERWAATVRALDGQPTVLDAAYNAASAAAAGGAHTYQDGVVLRVEPDQPVLQVVDRSLLESGAPIRAEDVVYVAIRQGDRSLYDPGQVVTLRDVAVDAQKLDDGSSVYVLNAALDGSRVEPTGKIDLQNALQGRLQRVDADLAVQSQELASEPSPTPTPGGSTQASTRYRGPSFIDDYLMWMWLTNGGFYRGSSTTIVNPPPAPSRPQGDYYYVPPASTTSSTPSAGAATSRSTALQAARNAVSGQASGTGGGTAATTKAAADSSARASAATSKAAAAASQVSRSSAGKSITSVPSTAGSASSKAARSAGSTTARPSTSVGGKSGSSSSSSGSKGSTGSVGKGSSGFGGGGVSGGGAS